MDCIQKDKYITHQLIPYLGNKRKLLPLIIKAIQKTGLDNGTFYDVFTGSTVVARLAKSLGYKVIANDWEPYSYYTGVAYLKNNHEPAFSSFDGLSNAISRLNNLQPVHGYIAAHYCPKDDENYDPEIERMFYTQENGRRIDAIREEIAAWYENGLIDRNEEAVLLASLIYQSAYCSNTSGVFKGFHRGWGGATKTAWYRIRSKLTLSPPVFIDNRAENIIYQADASTLIDDVICDIAYLDPPYNQHQYGANYHLLNTIALWDKPKVNPKISQGSERDKSAIRKDWRTDRRSLYCYKSSAENAFNELVSNIKAKYLLVSYSTDGIIGFDNLLEILSNRGELSVVTEKYKRYRVSSQRPSHKSHNVEFIVIVDTEKRSNQSNIQMVKHSLDAEHINTLGH
ncbi:MAG: DNA adenine methylase [Armatimonadota bacterium]